MADKEWLYTSGGDQQQGPVTSKQLREMAESGRLQPDDLVWKEGMEEWLRGDRIKGLTFAEPEVVPVASSHPAPAKPMTTETVQTSIKDAQKKVEEAAGVLWFLDITFKHFVSATIIRVIWCVYLVLVVLAVSFGSIGIVWIFDFRAIFVLPLMLIALALNVMFFRVCLEAFMVMFRMAEHMRDISEKLPAKQ